MSKRLVTVLVATMAVSPVFGQDDSASNRLEQTIRSWQQLGDTVRGLSIEEEDTWWTRKKGEEWKQTRFDKRTAYYARPLGVYVTDEREWVDGVLKPVFPNTPEYRRLINNQYEAVITTKNNEDWLIQEIELPGTGTTERDLFLPANLSRRILWLRPDGATDWFKLLVSRQIRVTSVAKTGMDGVSRITFVGGEPAGPSRFGIELTAEDERAISGVISGHLDIDTNHHSAILSANIVKRGRFGEYAANQAMEYDFGGDVPFLKRCVREVPESPRPDGTVSFKSETKYRPFHADPAECWLSYYGLPEPIGVTAPPKHTPRYVWLLLAAAALGCLAAVLHLVRKRSGVARAAPPPSVRT
jgi:hypothetical protein